jgi:hypothetical protein
MAATVLVACTLMAVRITAADQALQQALAAALPLDRSVQLMHFGDRRYQDAQNASEAERLLAPFAEFSGPVIAASVFPLDDAPGTVVALDNVEQWTVVTGGKAAAPCVEGQTCEAVVVGGLIGERVFPIGSTISIGTSRITVVGSVDVLPTLPLGLEGDDRWLLVNGRAAFVADNRTAENPRADRWSVVIDPARLHSWQLGLLSQRIEAVGLASQIGATSFSVTSPVSLIRDAGELQGIASGRIIFIGSFILAVLCGFAVFVAAVDRRDLEAEYGRLIARGAQHGHLIAAVVAEAVAPSVVGAALGIAAGVAVTAALAGQQGLPPVETVVAALLDQSSVLIVSALIVGTLLAVAVGIHPRAGRLVQPRLIGAVVAPVLIVLAWDRTTRGGVVSGRELITQSSGPTTVLMPGLLGIAVILGALVVLPRMLRRLARLLRRSSTPVRLAALSLAREPIRPAASMTLLALSVGSAVFAATYAATLRAGVETHSAFVAGMDLRVIAPTAQTPFAATVMPAIRDVAAQAGASVAPLTRLQISSAGGAQVSLLGIQAGGIPSLRDWRSDYSSLDPVAVAGAIRLEGDWQLKGQPIQAGARQLSIQIEAKLDPDPPVAGLEVLAIVDTRGLGYRRLDLGVLLAGTHTYSAAVTDAAELEHMKDGQPAGWAIVALMVVLPEYRSPSIGFGGPRQGAIVSVHGLEGLVRETDHVEFALSATATRWIIRQPAPTDGLALPAIVSPDLMSEVDAGGLIALRLPSGESLPIKPVGTANYFPTVTEPGRRLVIVDEDPLLMALNTRNPGGTTPSEAMIAVSRAARPTMLAALRAPEMPRLDIIDREALIATASRDPFATGVAWALFIGALAGLALALVGVALGAAAELADPRGDFAELEERGLGPRTIRRLLIVRTMIMSSSAGVVGLLVGLTLTWLSASTFAVNPDGTTPTPPLLIAVPVIGLLGMVVGIATSLIGTVALLAHRHFGARLLRQSRG